MVVSGVIVWKNVFSHSLKVAGDCEVTTSADRLFHRWGAAAPKAQSPAIVSRVRRTMCALGVFCYVSLCAWTRGARSAGALFFADSASSCSLRIRAASTNTRNTYVPCASDEPTRHGASANTSCCRCAHFIIGEVKVRSSQLPRMPPIGCTPALSVTMALLEDDCFITIRYRKSLSLSLSGDVVTDRAGV